jgi:hypothetical protein
MDLVAILVSLLRAGWPLPDFNDKTSFVEWWTRLGPVVYDLKDQILPGVVCAAGDENLIVAAVQEQVPEANGEMIRKLLAFLLEALPFILPYFLPKPAPAPTPGPVT